MAGLIERTGQGTTYLSIVDRNICERSQQERTEKGWEQIETENPQTKKKTISWIKRHQGIEDVFITDIRWFEQQIENATLTGWNLRLEADGSTWILRLPLTQNSAKRFMKLADNIDFTKPVTIKVWKSTDKETGKVSTTFCVYQNGSNIPQALNRDDLPEAKFLKSTKKWDFTEQDEFLVEHMNTVTIPQFKEVVGTATTAAKATPVVEEADSDDATEENIPF